MSFPVFKCFCFPAKCAKAGWLLEASYVGHVLLAVMVDMYGLCLISKTHHLVGRVPPLWYPGGHFGSLGKPWGTMGAAGRTPWGPDWHQKQRSDLVHGRYGGRLGSVVLKRVKVMFKWDTFFSSKGTSYFIKSVPFYL